jgi:nucleoside 2-deoxyribosyltransferase
VIRVYLAAPFQLQRQAIDLMGGLHLQGIGCTSRWLVAEETNSDEWARNDLADVAEADVFVALNPEGWRSAGTGGRHVEFGYALALRKPIVLVGVQSHIFHHISSVVVVPAVDDDVLMLDEEIAQAIRQARDGGR